MTSERGQQISGHLKWLINEYKEPTRKLISFCRDINITDTRIAEVLGITKQALGQQYGIKKDKFSKEVSS